MKSTRPSRPTIVCLCGSTRFMEAFFAAGWELTLMGQIVLSVGVCKHADGDNAHGAELAGVAEQLDELHLRKIDLADWALILNVEGYYGESTAAEMQYATDKGKPFRMLFSPALLPRSDQPPEPDDYPSWDTIAAAAREAAEAQGKT